MSERAGSRIGESFRARADSPTSDRSGLPPKKAFTILLGILLVAGILLLLTKPDSKVATQETSIEESQDFALTDAEAIERFRFLDRLRIQIYRTRDETLIPEYLAPNSPLRSSTYADLRRLVRTNTTFEPNLKTIDIRVISNFGSRVMLRQIALEQPEFRSARTNEELSSSQDKLRLVVDWTMTRHGSTWLIQNSRVVAARTVHQ